MASRCSADAYSDDGEPVSFPCAWPEPGQEVLPQGAHGLVSNGQLHGFVVGSFAERYSKFGPKLIELNLEYADLWFKESDGRCVSQGMVWRDPR